MKSRFVIVFFVFAFALGLLTGCEKLSQQDIYQRPDWLPGKLYTTVSAQENLSVFSECIKQTGLDSILDVSGIWSVFAPTNEAMQQYLVENQYTSISDIPLNELERITKFHIVQNPWSLEQLQTLGSSGWRVDEDENKNSYAYKRQTILRNPNEHYWVRNLNGKDKIVLDSKESDRYKKVFVQSRKYVPIFYDAYMDINGLTSEDFMFYFDREYERGNIYFAGAKIIHADIFAENGFVHIIDKVVSPMLNAKELLEREMPDESYKLFLEMVYWYYPEFEPNMVATNNQPAVIQGGVVDTLWNLKFSNPLFEIHQEHIGEISYFSSETLIKHNGLVAPTNDTFREFIDNVLTIKSGFQHWNDSKSLPNDIVELIMDRHFEFTPLYPSNQQYKKVFRRNNGFRQDENAIVRKEFGSNCTFIGINSYKPDQVFTSVTGPVFLRPSFSIFRRAMQYCNVYDDIAYHDGELYFFALPDYALIKDSSLVINWINKEQDIYNFLYYNNQKERVEVIGRNTLKKRILNQVGIPISIGSENRELVKTLGGKYLTWDHTNNTIKGSLPCTVWNTGERVSCKPVPLEEPTENGKTYRVSYWFQFIDFNL